jgi:hypothetical protein
MWPVLRHDSTLRGDSCYPIANYIYGMPSKASAPKGVTAIAQPISSFCSSCGLGPSGPELKVKL